MIIAKQMDVRSNIKKYFDMAYDGETVIIPRKQDHNVVIISESEYNRLTGAARLTAYAQSMTKTDAKRNKSNVSSKDLKTHNLNKLDSIRSLGDNWNGNGAPTFSGSLTDRIESLINELNIQPEVFPTACETIQLEYDNSRRDHMEIEIGESDTAEVYIIRFNGEEIYSSIPVASNDINRLVGDFYG